MWHTISILAAIAGAIRYKLGQLLLAGFLRLNRGLPAAERFQLGWHFIYRFRWLFRGREFSGNRYRCDWKNFAFMKLLRALEKGEGRFVPGLRVNNAEALTRLADAMAPIVAVTIHSRVEDAVNRVFEDCAVTYSVIAVSNVVQSASRLLGLKGTMDLIPLTDDSLLIARRKLKAGRLIATAADFTVRVPGTLYHDVYVAEGLFEFARNSKAKLVYAVSNVAGDGVIEVSLFRPTIDEQQSSAAALARDFIECVGAVSPGKDDLKIGPWTLRTRSRISQHDNLCIRRLGGKRSERSAAQASVAARRNSE